MGEFFEKVKHVATKACAGAIKGAMWGCIAVGVMAAISMASIAIPVIGWVAGAIGGISTWAMAGTIVSYAALGGAALGGLDGISSTDQVLEDKLTIQKKQISQGNMLAALEERQRALNAGGGNMSVLAQNQLPNRDASLQRA